MVVPSVDKFFNQLSQKCSAPVFIYLNNSDTATKLDKLTPLDLLIKGFSCENGKISWT